MTSKRVLQVSATTLSALFLAGWLTPIRMCAPYQQALSYWARIHASLAGWVMHLVGMPVWVDRNVLRTDLYAYPITDEYHGATAAAIALTAALIIAIWRHKRPIAYVFLAASALAAAMFWNTLRIVLIIRFGPSPQASNMASLLRDSSVILLIMMLASVLLLALLLDAARHLQRQRIDPLPGATSGALSELPPFWHAALRRYRFLYILIPGLAVITLITYASRPARRLRGLSSLVVNMSAQGYYEDALRLGYHVAQRQPTNTEWQLRLIRLMLLAGKTDAALAALSHLPDTAEMHHADEVALLTTHAYILRQDWPQVRAHQESLHAKVSTDPIWQIILLELAVAQGDQQAVLNLALPAALAFTQTDRLLPAIPILERSGRWQAFLAVTRHIPWQIPPQNILFSQIMAKLQLDQSSAAAERILFAVQRTPDNLDLLIPMMILTRQNPTEWEPRLAQLLQNVTRTTADPDTLLNCINAAFASNRPDLAWPAFLQLQQKHPHSLHTQFALATHADRWFLFRSHHLQLPAASSAATTDLLPMIILGKHIPLFLPTTKRIPQTENITSLLANRDAWQQQFRTQLLQQLAQDPAPLQHSKLLRLAYAALLEQDGRPHQAYQQFLRLGEEQPEWAHIASFHQTRLEQQRGDTWEAYTRQRDLVSQTPALTPEAMHNKPPQPLPRHEQTANQLPRLVQLIDLLWSNRQCMTAIFTAREGLRRFPDDPLIRTILADMLLQRGDPGQALHLLQQTSVRRSAITDALEADALLATGRNAVVPTFRRQRMLPPQPTTTNSPPPERLPPAEHLLTPLIPTEITIIPPVPENPIAPLFTQSLHNLATVPDLNAWLTVPSTRLEQAEAMHLLMTLMQAQGRTELAHTAARLAVAANPHEPALWAALLRCVPDPHTIITTARNFCPHDPDLWLAEIVLTCMPRNQAPPQALQRLLQEAHDARTFPVDTLVRAADFLWRGAYYAQATKLINQFYGRERGLLSAHLLGLTAAERAGNRGRALYHIEAAIEATGEAGPELYARFIKSKIHSGEIDSDGNIVNALRHLRRAEPQNPLWAELLGFVRYNRGGAEIREGGLEMQSAISTGSTNRLPYLIAAEGLRRINRTADAAQILHQGLRTRPGDPIILNNLAYTLAENPASTAQALNLIPDLTPHAENNHEIRDTLAFVLLRNHELEAARKLLARNLQENSPDSRIWFRSQMHLAEIAWRQGRTQIATSMLQQLLHGARNIPDEDVLTANRLLLQMTVSP